VRILTVRRSSRTISGARGGEADGEGDESDESNESGLHVFVLQRGWVGGPLGEREHAGHARLGATFSACKRLTRNPLSAQTLTRDREPSEAAPGHPLPEHRRPSSSDQPGPALRGARAPLRRAGIRLEAPPRGEAHAGADHVRRGPQARGVSLRAHRTSARGRRAPRPSSSRRAPPRASARSAARSARLKPAVVALVGSPTYY